MTRRAIARAAAVIAAVTVLARVVGFLRIAVFTHTVGTNPLGDTYQTANLLPNIVFEIVAGGALAAVVVPVVAGTDREHARQTASGLLTWVVVALVPVALVGAALGRPLMSLLAGGTADPVLRARKVEVGARMLVVFMPQVVLYGVGIVATGVLQAHRRFVGPALAPLLSSVVVIATYLAYAATARTRGDLASLSRGAELLLALGTTAGVAVLTLSLFVPLRSLRLRLRPTLRLPEGVGARVRRLAASGLLGVVAQQVALAVALRLCNVEPGAVVVYQVAFTVYLLPWAVLAVPVATSAFPALAEAYEAGDAVTYATVARDSTRTVVVAMAAAAAALVAVAWPAAAIVAGVQHSTAAPGAIPRAVVAFAPGLLGYGLLALHTRALYARHQARAVAVATVAGFGVAAAGSVVAVALVDHGVFGLTSRLDRVAAVAAANSLGMLVAGLLLVLALRRAAGADAVHGVPAVVGRAVAGAVAGGVAGSVVASVVPGADPVRAVLAGSVAVAVALVAQLHR